MARPRTDHVERDHGLSRTCTVDVSHQSKAEHEHLENVPDSLCSGCFPMPGVIVLRYPWLGLSHFVLKYLSTIGESVSTLLLTRNSFLTVARIPIIKYNDKKIVPRDELMTN